MDTNTITFLIFIISIVITIVITKYYSITYKLRVIVTEITKIVDVGKWTKDIIKILYNGKEINSLNVIRVVIENDGNHDLSKEQINKNPRIVLDDCLKIINLNVLNKSPKTDIKAIVCSENEIEFGINFLGRGRWCGFQIIVHHEFDEIINSKHIHFDDGIIKDTKINYNNLDKDNFVIRKIILPLFEATIFNFGTIYFMYILLFLVIFCYSLIKFLLIAYSIDFMQIIFGIKQVSKDIGILMLSFLLSFLTLSLTLYFGKRNKYFSIFRKMEENTKNSP